MKLLNFKIPLFLFIIGLSYCLPVFVFADCQESFRVTRITDKLLPSEAEFWRVVINEKGIKIQFDYNLLRKTDEELQRFPTDPKRRYPGFKWPGKGTRVTTYITDDLLPSEIEFQQVVIGEKDIRTQNEYYKKRQTDKTLSRFPSSPIRRYPGFKWPGRGLIVVERVTNAKLPSEAEFRQVIIMEKDIRTQFEYQLQRQTDKEIRRFPSIPKRRYPGFRWPGRHGVTKRILVTDEKLPSIEEFWQFVIIEKDIKTEMEYRILRQTDDELKDFPSVPQSRYTNFKWPGRSNRAVE